MYHKAKNKTRRQAGGLACSRPEDAKSRKPRRGSEQLLKVCAFYAHSFHRRMQQTQPRNVHLSGFFFSCPAMWSMDWAVADWAVAIGIIGSIGTIGIHWIISDPWVWPQTPRFHSHKHRGLVHLGDQVCFVRELGEKRSSKDRARGEDHVML